ncbi:hypothetical protein BMR03_09135 [Methylococcaceae bacterium HT2]|nr:hypothetical protein BMR09_10380 [Methylococcaceae bacterium CS3]TXL22265.1 hypothetical protein BMR03_09135 [Methylococcaceae bacterium HT2]
MKHNNHSTQKATLLLLILSLFSVTNTTAEINSIIIDRLSYKVIFNGSGFTGSDFIVAGESLSPTVIISGTVQHLTFSQLEPIITRAGSYNVEEGGAIFTMYVDTAIIAPPPITTDCPCQPEWDNYGSIEQSGGFSGLVPTCKVDNVDQVQVAVQFYNPTFLQYWILTTEFNSTATECALVLDSPTRELDSLQEHNACASYLRTNYINVYSPPDC